MDMASADEALFEMMTRTFAAEREVYYSPYSGRQMGYGQGYLTGAVLMLDLVEEYTACVNASANLCYHHTDVPYVVPEGVILSIFIFRKDYLYEIVYRYCQCGRHPSSQ